MTTPIHARMVKYPRTRHIAGSKLQPGDEDLSQVPVEALAGRPLVIEEKLDGANAGLSFQDDGRLLLQSRGHFLTGGHREKHFARFKAWAATERRALREVLGRRYVMFGEWLFAKHTVYYDALPHWFMEFDLWDRDEECFLDTDRRRRLLSPVAVSQVPVLKRGTIRHIDDLRALIGSSLYKTPKWRTHLADTAAAQGLDVARVIAETDALDAAEGLYLKHEEGGRVVGRYKFIRPSFLQSVQTSGSHWLNRPIVPNRLADPHPECL